MNGLSESIDVTFTIFFQIDDNDPNEEKDDYDEDDDDDVRTLAL